MSKTTTAVVVGDVEFEVTSAYPSINQTRANPYLKNIITVSCKHPDLISSGYPPRIPPVLRVEANLYLDFSCCGVFHLSGFSGICGYTDIRNYIFTPHTKFKEICITAVNLLIGKAKAIAIANRKGILVSTLPQYSRNLRTPSWSVFFQAFLRENSKVVSEFINPNTRHRIFTIHTPTAENTELTTLVNEFVVESEFDLSKVKKEDASIEAPKKKRTKKASTAGVGL